MNVKLHRTGAGLWLCLMCFLTLPAVVQAQFLYTTNNGVITITGYTGPGGDVAIPNTIDSLPVTSIGDNAFYGHITITGITIPDCVTSIGDVTFASCGNLTGVTIGSGVTSIGMFPFENCQKLVAITVDDANAAFSSPDAVLLDKSQTTIIQFPRAKPGSYTIPGTVTKLGHATFNGCTALTNVSIPGSVTVIREAAFYFCTSLVSVTIESGVRSITDQAFQDCANLRSVIIPGSVTNVGQQAFYHCRNLTNAAIPNGVVSIGTHAFDDTGLTSITIPDSVVSIGQRAFFYCRNVTNITIGKAVVSIGPNAFSYAGGAGGYDLTRVNFMGNAPAIHTYPFDDGTNVFVGVNSAIVYYLPGTTGWGSAFSGRPTRRWLLPNPTILTFPPYFGVQTNQFGFRISWATNRTTVVEACTNLASLDWVPLATNTTAPLPGWFYFSDPEWTNYPSRLYRVRSH